MTAPSLQERLATMWAGLRAVADAGDGSPPPAAYELVSAVLAVEAEQGDDVAEWLASRSPYAEAERAKLALAVSSTVADLSVALDRDEGPATSVGPTAEPRLLDDGSTVLEWDARLADWWQAQESNWGEVAEQAAIGIRCRAGDRWERYECGVIGAEALWAEWFRRGAADVGQHHLLVGITGTLWKTKYRQVAAEQREHVRKRHPGLPKFVFETADRALLGPLHRVEQEDQVLVCGSDNVPVATLDPNPPSVPAVQLKVAEQLVTDGLGSMSRIIAHRFLRGIVRESHQRKWTDDPDWRVLQYRGWGDLNEAINTSRSNDDQKLLKKVVFAFDAMQFHLPDRSTSRLISLRWRDEHGPGCEPLVEITVLSPLHPFYAQQTRRRAEPIIPIIDLPPMFGRQREYGLLASLQMRVLVFMRKRAVEAVQHGGVRIRTEDWLQLAAPMKRLPEKTILQAPAAWSADGDDAPAFLSRIEQDRFALGEAHADAWDFIVEGGKKSIDGTSGRPRREARRRDARKSKATQRRRAKP